MNSTMHTTFEACYRSSVVLHFILVLLFFTLNVTHIMTCTCYGFSWNVMHVFIDFGSSEKKQRYFGDLRMPPLSLCLCYYFHLFEYWSGKGCPCPLFRKHALNCHRMKPALFNVLCEIKEKTGELFFIVSFICWTCVVLAPAENTIISVD